LHLPPDLGVEHTFYHNNLEGNLIVPNNERKKNRSIIKPDRSIARQKKVWEQAKTKTKKNYYATCKV